MKKVFAVFFQTVVVFIALCALAFLLIEPHFEGRNSGATWFQIYFNDPFLLYVYIGSIPFFIGLYCTCMLVKHIGHNKISVKMLQGIRHCALALIAFIVGGLVYIAIHMSGKDDIAGGIALGLLMILFSSIGVLSTHIIERCIKRRGI